MAQANSQRQVRQRLANLDNFTGGARTSSSSDVRRALNSQSSEGAMSRRLNNGNGPRRGQKWLTTKNHNRQ